MKHRMFSPNTNRNPSTTFMHQMDMPTEEVRTIYFALREYRDNLHKSLQNTLYKDLSIDDYRESDYLEHVDTGQPITDFAPDLLLTAMMNPCTEYEELMFLHETLFKINSLLFDLMQNYDTATKTTVKAVLDVD